MPLDEADLRAFQRVLDIGFGQFKKELIAMFKDDMAVEAGRLPLLDVEQFSVAVELSIETIRRKIRCGEVPEDWVFGKPYKISPKALGQFGVTPQEARQRLEARNLLPATQPLPG